MQKIAVIEEESAHLHSIYLSLLRSFLAHAASLAAASARLASLLRSLGKETLVRRGLLGRLRSGSLLGKSTLALALENDWGDQTLNLGSFGHGLSLLVERSRHDVLSQVVGLGQGEELTDLLRTLGSETDRHTGILVGQSRDRLGSNLHDLQVNDGKIGSDDASPDGLALALSFSARAVAGVRAIEKKADTSVRQHTLLHGKSLLVVTSADSKDVSSEILGHVLSVHLLSHTFVVERAKLFLIVDLHAKLRSDRGIRNVQLRVVFVDRQSIVR